MQFDKTIRVVAGVAKVDNKFLVARRSYQKSLGGKWEFPGGKIKEGDKEQIEDLCILAINRALEQAEKVYEAEMKDIAKGMLPGIGV